MYIHWSEMVFKKNNGLVIFDNDIKSSLVIVYHVTINVWVFEVGQLIERIQNTRRRKSKLARSFEAWSATHVITALVIKSNVMHCLKCTLVVIYVGVFVFILLLYCCMWLSKATTETNSIQVPLTWIAINEYHYFYLELDLTDWSFRIL